MDFRYRSARWIWVAVPATFLYCASVAAADSGLPPGEEENSDMSMFITSPAFTHNGMIPAIHTCDGQNVSPRLEWTGVPAGTRSLALVVDDPDAPDPAAPKMTWVHWVLYNIPVDSAGLPEGPTAEMLPTGTLQGLNDWHRVGYGGPCPPKGKHRYLFKLYALDTVLPDLKRPAKSALEKAMQGHVLARSELIGLYQRR
jgi:Raf kinase inhibitor-like YbhB/YbcL family protein